MKFTFGQGRRHFSRVRFVKQLQSSLMPFPFPTIRKLQDEVGVRWNSFEMAAKQTEIAEENFRQALVKNISSDRLLNPDVSLVLCGSFARYEMAKDSDYDWMLLVDGVVDNAHVELARKISKAIVDAGLVKPGSSGTFGNMVFSHELVHHIGGGADSNANLTRRVLTLLESRPLTLSIADSSRIVWDNVLNNILERYFEEDVHFSPDKGSVPRFLLNDLTRYWRTICVDYAAKYQEQDGKKWAIRNAKLRFSRKLIYASGLAFCLGCQLKPPSQTTHGALFPEPKGSSVPFIHRAKSFATIAPLEYLAAFVDSFVHDQTKRKKIVEMIFGNYDWWLGILADKSCRMELEEIDFEASKKSKVFQDVSKRGRQFAQGLELLFFGRDRDSEKDPIANLAIQYIGF